MNLNTMCNKLKSLSLVGLGALIISLGLTNQACSARDTAEPETTACAAAAVEIDPFKEIIIVDEDVLADARSKNAAAGQWSFRYVMENMAASWVDPQQFVQKWLDGWETVPVFNTFPLNRPNEHPRQAVMREKVLCPWYKRTPANACNNDCSSCAANTLDLAQSPFRLLAIANRLDLREHVALRQSGEARLVFGLTEGAADDPASVPLPMTVIFEFALPQTRTTAEWATAWHQLGAFPAQDEPYRAALASLTDSFVKRGSRVDGVNESALGQVRTNESYLNWIWQQREFGINKDGLLTMHATRNTPGESLNASSDLSTWVNANKDAIMKDRYELPASMLGASSNALSYTWTLPGVDLATRNAFARGTCNGCHTTEHPSVDTAFHVSPYRKGRAKLSPFMYDPTAASDDVRARTASMRRALCEN